MADIPFSPHTTLSSNTFKFIYIIYYLLGTNTLRKRVQTLFDTQTGYNPAGLFKGCQLLAVTVARMDPVEVREHFATHRKQVGFSSASQEGMREEASIFSDSTGDQLSC